MKNNTITIKNELPESIEILKENDLDQDEFIDVQTH
ncbi:hypothetical protein BH18ACI3_BH18ACI3_20200 [soil metagenome]